MMQRIGLDGGKLSNSVQFLNSPMVSVVMTTFNVEQYVQEAIESILNQTYSRIEIIIVDDASTDRTRDIIQRMNDPRIRLFKNTINCGTYYSKNFGITAARGEYIAIQDSDDISHEFRIEKQVSQLESNPSLAYSLCQYTRFDKDGQHLIPPRLGFQSALIRRKVFHEIGYYDSVRVAADDEFDSRMRLYYGRSCRGVIEELLYFNRQREDSLTEKVKIASTPRIQYVEQYRLWHEQLSKDECYTPFPLKVRKFPASDQIIVPYREAIEPNQNVVEVKTNGRTVTASMATIPSRLENLPEVLASILPQVDRLNVFLNGIDVAPEFLNHEKITIASSKQAGVLDDNGKFFWANDLYGFHLTVDDDIIYPDDYVRTLTEKLENFNYEAAVGVHGIIVNDQFLRYYDETSRTVYHFAARQTDDLYVHIIGTGTLAYHSSRIHFTLEGVRHTRMVDLYFALYCQQNGIPIVSVARNRAWLREIETPNETRIYQQFILNDSIQTELVTSIQWRLHRLSFDLNEIVFSNDGKNDRLKEQVEKLIRRIDEQRKSILALENKVFEMEKWLIEKDKEIVWYRAHIEDFRQNSIDYRLRNSRLIPKWLRTPGKTVKKALLLILPKRIDRQDPL